MKNLIIIKLGGSIITDKTAKQGVFRQEIVERIAQEIKAAQEKNGFDLILVHGAGSFGHPIAKKYRLNEGYIDGQSSEGFAKTKIGVMELNLLVKQELSKANLAACIIESSAVIKAHSGKIKKIDLGFIRFLLASDIIPILSGDVVIDQETGFSIISGDQIASHLARKLRAKTVVFVSDVNGIFDKNPKTYKDAQLIGEINNRNYHFIVKNMKTNNLNDVTGEMGGKILAIKKDLSGIKALIINGLKKENLLKSLIRPNGHKIGTVLEF